MSRPLDPPLIIEVISKTRKSSCVNASTCCAVLIGGGRYPFSPGWGRGYPSSDWGTPYEQTHSSENCTFLILPMQAVIIHRLFHGLNFQVARANGEQGNFRPEAQMSLLLNLSAGQRVWVEPFSSQYLYGANEAGYMYSWFSAYLIHAS